LKKIIIIGSGGAGKSTLALRLGELLNLPVYHLDRLFWKPGWVEADRDEFRAAMIQIMGKDEWIIDGNFDSTLPLRLQYCDTVIMLDYSRLTCFTGYFKRYVKYKGITRPSMTEGCDEKLDLSYLKWLWNFPKIKLKIIDEIYKYKETKKVLIFKNRKETERFVVELK
jgi:adenylate kinase family enzyme